MMTLLLWAETYSHGQRVLKVLDTPFGGLPAQLHITFPRRRCAVCGNIWQPTFENVNVNHKMTDRAYTDIAQKSLGSTFRNVSNEYTLSHVTIKDVFMEFVREHRQKLRFRTPAFLGIDEIKIKKIGEVTVITDLEHRTLYDMLKGRNQAALTEYL